MPARKRVQGQQRRLRKYLRTQAAAYGNDPAALEAREQQLEASLAKLDADLAKLGAEAVDDAVDDADSDADERPAVPDAEPDAEYEADDLLCVHNAPTGRATSSLARSAAVDNVD